jgi:hypothetical protein
MQQPIRPEEREAEETEVRERLAMLNEDVKSAVDPRKTIADIQRNLQQPSPR